MMSNECKKCFVITPIGSDNSPIRRHIDGIIDQAIIPALGEKYTIEVAHRKYEIGSINDRVIKSIYSSDLVIANLTELNPNVMFELAIRYSFGKPAIVIAEEGTKLPFDIVDENTIFYINDPAGANDLKQRIINFEANIDLKKQEYGPVYKAVSTIPLYNEVESGEEVSDKKLLSYIVKRLDLIDHRLGIDIARKRDDITDVCIKFTYNYNENNISKIYDYITKEFDEKYSGFLVDKEYFVIGLGQNMPLSRVHTIANNLLKHLVEIGMENVEWKIEIGNISDFVSKE